jgi:hypothetical protein
VKPKQSSRIIKEDKKGRVTELLHDLTTESGTIAKHLHVAAWQYMQYNKYRNNPELGELIMLSDFSENYRNEHQRQPKAVHWGYNQTTVHPIILNYICPEKECGQIVKESVIGVSKDLKHDAWAAHCFEQRAFQHILEDRKMTINKISKWSDGGHHYKSKNAFLLATKEKCEVERNYFGSEHGKSLSDGEGAVAKHLLTQGVKCQEVFIDDAKGAYEFLKSKMDDPKINIHQNKHQCRIVQYVEIERNLPVPLPDNVKGVAGTRDYHCVKSLGYGKVNCRNLSCHNCRISDTCHHDDFLNDFVKHNLVKETSKKPVMMKKGIKKKSASTKTKSSPLAGAREQFFQEAQKRLEKIAKTKQFKHFREECERLIMRKEYQKYLLPEPNDIYASDVKIDKLACQLLPDDSPEGYMPRITGGDGNCLFRCISQITFGSDLHYTEMRVRAICELSLNSSTYTDPLFLKVGLYSNVGGKGEENLAKYYCQFLPNYCMTQLDTSEILRLYRYVFFPQLLEKRTKCLCLCS